MEVVAKGKIKNGRHIITAKNIHDINNGLNTIRLTTELEQTKWGRTRFSSKLIESTDNIVNILRVVTETEWT